jgi:hypothetical protein
MIHGKYTIYPETVHGPNQDRDIKTGDWRDPDQVLDVAGFEVVELDRTGAGRRVVLQAPSGEHIDLNEWLQDKVGLRLVLPIIARDFQQHQHASE